jgi:DNA-binding CsgD family transcriptional regulator
LYFGAARFVQNDLKAAALFSRNSGLESYMRLRQMTARVESIVDRRMERPLLHLHAASDVDSFWQSVQDVIGAVIPTRFIGLTLQHSPISPRIARSTQKLSASFFPIAPIEKYFNAQPHRNVVFIRDFFSDERHFKRSSFYRGCMVPLRGRCAIGLFFWDIRRLLAAIIVARSARQGELSPHEMKLIRRLHAQFQTALGRLRLLERERGERVAFEQFMRRVPLPTVLLRWNLKLIYRNQAATEFCAVWQRGPSAARLVKLKAPLPPEVLDQCRVLKKRWEQLKLGLAPVNFKDEAVLHPTRRDLRATISLKQISSAAVARPHFLIEFEDLRESAAREYRSRSASLSHLVRLTTREQNLAHLVCDGRSNQEIADDTGLSLETVKKHLHSIFCKLEIPSRSRLMVLMR